MKREAAQHSSEEISSDSGASDYSDTDDDVIYSASSNRPRRRKARRRNYAENDTKHEVEARTRVESQPGPVCTTDRVIVWTFSNFSQRSLGEDLY